MKSTIVFFLSTAATSMSVLFIPLIAAEMGSDNLTIGLIVSLYGFMMLLSMYVFGWMSDNRGRMALIRAGLLASSIAFFLQPLAQDEIQLMLIRGFCGAAIGVFYSSLLIYGLESGKKIGKFTSYESLGWGIGNVIAGAIAIYNRIFLLSGFFFLICFLISLRLRDQPVKKIKTPLIPYKIVRKNARIFLPFLMRDIGAYSIWTFFPIYLIGLGASNLWIGIIYFLNTGGQFFLKQYVDKYNPLKLYRTGMIISALAFYAYTLPTSYPHVIPIQLMIALAWTTLSVGAMGILTDKNQEKASVIGLFSSTRGMAQIIAPVIGGAIMQYLDFTHLMSFSAAITFLGLAIHLSPKIKKIT
jgi:MFS family permease